MAPPNTDATNDQPWYRTFFGPSFWALVADEYVQERTEKEVAYLAETIAEYAPGHRLLDLGCGEGRLARGLARHGFSVTAVDVSTAALDGASAEPGVVYTTADLLAADPWPGGPVDAAILVQGFGWGSDADQRRLLTRIRERLTPGGVLILDLSTAAWILRHWAGPRSEANTERGSFVLEREYDPLTGRVIGAMVHDAGEGGPNRWQQSVRLYLVEQAIALAAEAGFDVVRVDADFVARAQVNLDSRYVQIVCRRAERPPDCLAVSLRGTAAGEALDLHWTPDEAEFIDPSPVALWERWWPETSAEALRLSAAYDLDDPYGGRRAAPLLTELHGVRLNDEQIIFGSGVTGLLATAAGLAERGPVVTGRYAHRDLAAWAASAGSPVRVVADPLAVALPDGAETVSLVVIDRPDPTGAPPVSHEALFAAARRLADRGVVLVVDESYANYFGPAASAIPLVNRLPNLVVLRGVAKGYCLGGLRSGWAVCSPELAQRLLARAVPLATSAASLRFTLELLAHGDVFASLRRRVDEMCPQIRAALDRVGVDTVASTPGLPWLTATAGDSSAERLRQWGISYKRLDPIDGRGEPVVRIGLPLSADRVRRFHHVLGSVEPS